MRKYAKGGLIQPFSQIMEYEVGEQIFPVTQMNYNIDLKKMKEVNKSRASRFAHVYGDDSEAVFQSEANLSNITE